MISYTLGQLYTAKTANFPLTDVRCARKLNEFAAWDWSGEFAESASLSEVYTNIRVLVFRETVSAKDPMRKTVSFRLHDGVNLSDTALWEAIRTWNEEAFVRDSPRLHPAPLFRESVETGDTSYRSAVILLKDGIEIADPILFENVWKRLWKENPQVGEKPWMAMALPFQESAHVSDYGNRGFQKNVFEPICPIENLWKRLTWNRAFLETVGAADKEYGTYIASYSEVCKSADAWIHGPSGVLYDISMSSGPMTLDEFKDTAGVPAGYSPFVDFRVGDYEYKEAMYRFIMQKKELGVTPLLYDVSVHVDIPDTEDRGTAVVNAEVTRVYYNKHFYNPPEVVATSVSGTESGGISVPVVLSTDKSDDAGGFFEVELQNMNGELVSGRISWTARGY